MACPKGGICDYIWDDKEQRHICAKCGKVAPFHPIDIGKLITQNKRMADQLSQIDEILESDKKPAVKVAELLLIRNEELQQKPSP